MTAPHARQAVIDAAKAETDAEDNLAATLGRALEARRRSDHLKDADRARWTRDQARRERRAAVARLRACERDTP